MNGVAVIRPATTADEPALARLWATAFTPALTPDQWLVDAQRHAHTLVAEDGDGLCGSIYGVRKRLREQDGATAVVHAIGSVAVDARARGRGLARRLVAASLETAGDADWALLFTGTPEVYRSSGFETFAMDRVLAGPWGDPGRGADAASVTDAVPGAVRRHDLDGSGALRVVCSAYERSRDGLTLAPVRSARDWAMAEVRLRGARLYTHPDADGSYIVAAVRGGTGVVIEAALPDSDDADGVHGTGTDADGIRRALLAAVAADWTAAGVTACDIAVPARTADERAVAAFAPEAGRIADRTGMTRALRRLPRLDGIRHFTEADYF